MAAGDGLVSMTPSSIAYSGTSATINASGGVDFSAVTELSLNGVFTSNYDNYLIVSGLVCSTNSAANIRWRASGSDASGSDYTWQVFEGDSTNVSGSRAASQSEIRISTVSTLSDGMEIHVYGPALAQPTACRSVVVYSRDSARIENWLSTHSLSTAYDGVSFFLGGAANFTGNMHVFGYEE